MKKRLLIIATAVMTAGSLYLVADEAYEHEARGDRWRTVTPYFQSAPPKPSAQAALYQNECGSCHMAYQPGLLPERSWKMMMGDLASHFGTDASLEAVDARTIGDYLTANAADVKGAEKHMARIAATVSATDPMRISQSAYFVREHREIPMGYVTQPEVKSFANCNACHQTAERGIYSERGIFIPNYGRWDD